MEIFDVIHVNLLLPAVLFCALGRCIASAWCDLKFLEPRYIALTIYLLVAIAFKGGVALSEAGLAKV